MNKSVNKIESVEILRGIAILAVISIHVTKLNLRDIDSYFMQYIVSLINVSSMFAVPLFIAISGFVLSIKYKNTIDLIDYLKKRIVKIIPPYLFFSTLYFLYGNWASECFIAYKGPGIFEFIYRLLTANACTHFWFFGLIIQLYLLFPLVLKIYNYMDSHNHAFKLVIISFTIQIMWNAVKYKLAGLISLPEGLVSLIISEYIMGLFLSHFGYFVLGIFLSAKGNIMNIKFPRFHNILLLLIFMSTSSVWAFANVSKYYDHGVTTNVILALRFAYEPVLAVVVSLFMYRLSAWILRDKSNTAASLKYIGHYAYGIYLIHFLILIEFNKLYTSLIKDIDITFYISGAVITTALSLVFLKIISSVPYLRELSGLMPPIKNS